MNFRCSLFLRIAALIFAVAIPLEAKTAIQAKNQARQISQAPADGSADWKALMKTANSLVTGDLPDELASSGNLAEAGESDAEGEVNDAQSGATPELPEEARGIFAEVYATYAREILHGLQNRNLPHAKAAARSLESLITESLKHARTGKIKPSQKDAAVAAAKNEQQKLRTFLNGG